MKTKFLFSIIRRLICIAIILFSLLDKTIAENHTDMELPSKAKEWFHSKPVRFVENKGQMTDMNKMAVPFVLFKASAPGIDMYITEKGLTYVFVKTEEGKEEEGMDGSHHEESVTREWSCIDMVLEGANIKKKISLKKE